MLKCDNTISYINIIVIIEKFVMAKEINMKKHYAFCIRVKKKLITAFMKIWLLDTSASTYFIPFESDMTLSYYGWVKTKHTIYKWLGHYSNWI